MMAGFASRPSPNLLPVFSPYVSLFTLNITVKHLRMGAYYLATLARPFSLQARLSKPASILLTKENRTGGKYDCCQPARLALVREEKDKPIPSGCSS